MRDAVGGDAEWAQPGFGVDDLVDQPVRPIAAASRHSTTAIAVRRSCAAKSTPRVNTGDERSAVGLLKVGLDLNQG
ncbi:hypothetical protein Ari01nite_81040 [Paractinoplanes rishiriensis]|uniref:Uncharacterized protein n=1 Tax=Paractinoplanes rishiriensis TaxID=1050105 RepID=A0A919K8I8_9ACTN|nr:hypothetical protein Ari01nite_81040 [Actinoplanes rishiriensis]